ncbi:MAG: TetR/AcrR family transcriptional regulator [Hyphomicrobiales bacterium]|nr:TetR/AcrR family transcriptional regulator [Hyphomicrobiales bacterium]
MKAKTALARKTPSGGLPKRKPASRNGRGGVRRGDTTRLSILDAAERCFGEAGFDGVSLRTITEVAGVDLALANYHFGTKDNLLREVIARRARIVHDERIRALEEARRAAGARSPSVEAIVTAFLEPLLRRLINGEQGWQPYANLVSQLDISPKFTGLTGDVLDPTALHFINALRLALPKVPPRAIYWGYMFLLGSMVQVMSATGRIERLSHGLCKSEDIQSALRELVPFVSGGLKALGAAPR